MTASDSHCLRSMLTHTREKACKCIQHSHTEHMHATDMEGSC